MPTLKDYQILGIDTGVGLTNYLLYVISVSLSGGGTGQYALESTLLNTNTILSGIESKTNNLDVLLSTRNSESTQIAIGNLISQIVTNTDFSGGNSIAKWVNLINSNVGVTGGKIISQWLSDIETTLLARLDVALSTRNTEATQLLVKAVLDTIKLKTDNLDVLLSTRNAEATQLLVKAKTDNLDIPLSGIKTGTDKIVSASFTGLLSTSITGTSVANLSTNIQTFITANPTRQIINITMSQNQVGSAYSSIIIYR